MKLKVNVKLTGLHPAMVVGLLVVYDAFTDNKCETTITSANDSKHGDNSLHHRDGQCRALDFRTKDYTGDKQALRDRIKADLGPDFDVVLEDLGGDNEHLHVEYDPKG